MGSAALPDSATYVPAVSDRRGSLPCGPAGCNSRRTVLASDLASATDWKGAWVQVSGKSRRQTRLPLTHEVGQAIATYIRAGRIPAQTDALFLRSRAPFRALGSHCAVSAIVDRAFRRAGVKRPGRGAAHLLRHSFASSMLRQGVPLQDISKILRHRSVETTQIYAKVDVTGLQQIAQCWPEVQPC